MVDAGVGLPTAPVECFGDELLLAPVDVPVVLLGGAPLPALEGAQDAVVEVGLEA